MSIIGTAGWNIAAQYKLIFPATGTQLEKYATRLNGVEINSSFYRQHQRKSYERWGASVPPDFLFSVKLPRTITHDRRLRDCGDLLDRFLGEVSGLGSKLGVILVQLPPSLAYDAGTVDAFFADLAQTEAKIACEPRHASWFTADADKTLKRHRIARVAADPPSAPAGTAPGGDTSLRYWRLHGSPRTYYSDYCDAALKDMAHKMRAQDWCIFDNTAAFHALGNALALTAMC